MKAVSGDSGPSIDRIASSKGVIKSGKKSAAKGTTAAPNDNSSMRAEKHKVDAEGDKEPKKKQSKKDESPKPIPVKEIMSTTKRKISRSVTSAPDLADDFYLISASPRVSSNTSTRSSPTTHGFRDHRKGEVLEARASNFGQYPKRSKLKDPRAKDEYVRHHKAVGRAQAAAQNGVDVIQ
ncbi:MAG: hypothetical protein Q9220_007313 [cf. Caloplaca sp. 1 TL-2023]